MTQPTPAEFQAEIIDVLGPNGERWHKGSGHNEDYTKLCLVSAAQRARSSIAIRHLENPHANEVFEHYGLWLAAADEVAREQFADRHRADGHISTVVMNDHPATKFPDILALLDKTRAKLEERL